MPVHAVVRVLLLVLLAVARPRTVVPQVHERSTTRSFGIFAEATGPAGEDGSSFGRFFAAPATADVRPPLGRGSSFGKFAGTRAAGLTERSRADEEFVRHISGARQRDGAGRSFDTS